MLKKWFGKKGDPVPPEKDAPEDDAPARDDTADPVAESTSPAPDPSEEAAGSEPESAAVGDAAPEKRSRWSAFASGLSRTRKGLKSLFTFRRSLDDAYLDEIEEELYRADFGPEAVAALIDGDDGLRAAWKEKRIERPEQVRDYLRDLLKRMLKRRSGALLLAEKPPTVILVAGVNGTGKTTSIAKLAKKLRDDGHKVILAAADTFRAAAVEQLTIWSERLGVDIVTGDPGADPASVAFRAVEAAVATDADILLVDTAGRLHNQQNLMRELGKIRRVLEKKIPEAPHESLLVLDATTGQNALNQARSFGEEIQVSGIILAKLDGTAKGGIAVTINNVLEIPVKFVGLGEGIDDLVAFDVDRFVDALLEDAGS